MSDEGIEYIGRVVPGEGPLNARLMIVGEAPGAQEERAGRPFVGPAGVFLDSELAAVGISRSDVYITNALKRRPNTTGRPRADDLTKWRGSLWQEIEVVRPSVILCLGSVAATTVIQPFLNIGRARGNWMTGPMGIKTMATFHPAYVRRSGQEVRSLFRSDLTLVAEELRRISD